MALNFLLLISPGSLVNLDTDNDQEIGVDTGHDSAEYILSSYIEENDLDLPLLFLHLIQASPDKSLRTTSV